MAGQPRNRIARLHADGTLDESFNPDASSTVYSLAVLPDGKIVASGLFYTLGGVSGNRVARLNADGTADTSFNPGNVNVAYALAVQPDGKVVIGGSFTDVDGQTRNRLARLIMIGLSATHQVNTPSATAPIRPKDVRMTI